MEWKLAVEGVMALITIGSTIAYVSYRLGKIEVKVDTVWEFMLRRAMSEASSKGMGSYNSPFLLSPEVKSWFSPDFRKALMDDYEYCWKGKGDKEIFLEVEKKYGDILLKEICIPHQLIAGACVLAAIEVAKGK